MRQYNDEALCPEKFEIMAKEYAIYKKQLDYKKSNLQKGITKNLSYVISLTDNLSKYHLSTKNKEHLLHLQNNMTKIKNTIDYKKVNINNINYCQNLQQCIIFCTKTLEEIIKLENCFLQNEKSSCQSTYYIRRGISMKHIITLNSRDIKKSVKEGGCGECQTSCQSACKTSCGIANQACEQKKAK